MSTGINNSSLPFQILGAGLSFTQWAARSFFIDLPKEVATGCIRQMVDTAGERTFGEKTYTWLAKPLTLTSYDHLWRKNDLPNAVYNSLRLPVGNVITRTIGSLPIIKPAFALLEKCVDRTIEESVKMLYPENPPSKQNLALSKKLTKSALKATLQQVLIYRIISLFFKPKEGPPPLQEIVGGVCWNLLVVQVMCAIFAMFEGEIPAALLEDPVPSNQLSQKREPPVAAAAAPAPKPTAVPASGQRCSISGAQKNRRVSPSSFPQKISPLKV